MLRADSQLVCVVLLLAAALSFHMFWVRDLTYFDEPRYAEVAVEMSEANSWAVPLLYDEPYTEKPPLYFWSAAAAGRAFGFSPGAFFLPNVLAHFLTALLVFDLGRRAVSRRAGAFAALLYAACPIALHYARSAQLDSLLVLGQTLAAWGFLLALEKGQARFGFAGSAGLAAATLVKGHVALFALLAPLSWCAVRRDFGFLRRPFHLLAGAVLALAPFCGWFAFVVRRFGWDAALDLYLHRQVVERTAGNVAHWAPVPVSGEYLAALALMLPGIAFLPGAFRAEGRHPFVRVVLAWGIAFFAIFALIPSKRELYLMPLAVPVALAVGEYLARVDAGAAPLFRFGREIGMFLCGLFLLGAAGLPVFLAVQGALSLNALLAAAAGLLLGVVALRAFRRGETLAPLLLLLQFAVFSAFAEPAIGTYSTRRFGQRAFGEAIQTHVAEGDPVIILGFDKAHAVRFFGRRRLQFADEVRDLATLIAPGTAAYVVTKAKDAARLERAVDYASERLARESRSEEEKGMLLLAVTRRSE